MNNVKLPVGISDFHKLRQNEYYYVDKTNLIKELLESRIAEVTLITRPRRFGKTIGMSMLAYFFDIRKDSRKLFEDLKISRDIELCQKWMHQYPTLFISFKDVDGLNFQSAMKMLRNQISWICNEHDYLSDSDKVNENDKKIFLKLQDISEENLSEDLIKISVATIIRMMNAHYGKPVILLLDEYDVPLAKASSNGYYKEMLDVMKTMMSTSLKDNSHLQFAVVTGCLKIAKESIFTGTNNFISDTIIATHLNEYFGFTDQEVKDILKDIGLQEHFKEIKEWYDGYRFGNTDIYNPWSVLKYFNNYCEAEPYWVQTSENSTIREIISGLDNSTCENLRALLNGSAVESIVDTNIIYPKLKEQQTNIFGFLLMTGYLKSIKTTRANGICLCELSIPNKEIKSVYSQEIVALLADKIDSTAINLLQQYLITKNGPALQNVLKKFLLETVSYYDTLKENYYQGLLLGMTGLFTNTYYISSNRESGEGRYDIQLLPKNIDMPGIIIEIKATADSSDAGLKKLAAEALTQIEDKKYDTELRKQNIKTIYKYGIAFSGKKVEIITN